MMATKHKPRRACGFVAMMRTPDIEELIEASPLAFALAAVIALRARFMPGLSLKGLHPGEAFVGDWKRCGLSRSQYRTAIHKLEKWGFIAIKRHSHGTVVKLIDTRLFDVSNVARDEVNRHHGSHQIAITSPQSNKGTRKQGNKGDCKTANSRVRAHRFPASVADVIVVACRRQKLEVCAQDLKAIDLSAPAGKILDGIADAGLRASVAQALRFVRFNNSRGWSVRSWRAALVGFTKASRISGATAVPDDWLPVIENG